MPKMSKSNNELVGACICYETVFFSLLCVGKVILHITYD